MGTRKVDRRGAAVVEAAMVLPLLFLMFIAAIEFSRANTVRNTVENAAYEGARRAILPGATAAHVEGAAMAALKAVEVTGGVVEVSPDPIVAETEEVTVVVSVPLDENAYTVPHFLHGRTSEATCTLRREHALSHVD